MTDIGLWTGAISQVGFPIVAFLLMYRLVKDTIQRNTEVLRDTRRTLAEIEQKLED